MAFQLTETNLFEENEKIGPLNRSEIVKLLNSCSSAVTAKFPVAGATDKYNVVRKNGEYGAYKLALAQICDAGYITSNLISTVQKFVSDGPTSGDKLKTTLTYYEMCQEVNTKQLDGRIVFETPSTESKNNGQYYYLSHYMVGCTASLGFLNGAILFDANFPAKQDIVAFDYLTFTYNNFLAGRIVTENIDKQVLAGLLSIALCSTYDDAVNFSKGVIKSDTNGVTAKYWYDYGWNALANQPKQVTEEAAIKITESVVDNSAGNVKEITTTIAASESPAPVLEAQVDNPLIKTIGNCKLSYKWNVQAATGLVELYYNSENIFNASVNSTSSTDTNILESLRILQQVIGSSTLIKKTNLAEVLLYLRANYDTDFSGVRTSAVTPKPIPSSATQPKTTVTETGLPPVTKINPPVPIVSAIPAGAAPASNTPTQTVDTPSEVKNQITSTCYVVYSNFGLSQFRIVVSSKQTSSSKPFDLAYSLGYELDEAVSRALSNLSTKKENTAFSSFLLDIEAATNEIIKNSKAAYDILNPAPEQERPTPPSTTKLDSPIVTNTINKTAIVEYSGNDSIPAAVIKVYYVNNGVKEQIGNICPADKSSILNQLNKAIDISKSSDNLVKVSAVTAARDDITANFDSDVSIINNHYKITPPTIVTTTKTDGTTITSTTITKSDGSIVTRKEAIDPTTGIVTKEEVIEKKALPEVKAQNSDVTDPVTSDVPIADQNKTEGLNAANSVDTYRANNQPSNIESLPASQQDPKKGFKDPENRYPLKSMVNKPDTNPLAVGVNSPNIQANPKTAAGDKEHMSAGASPAARNSSRKREVKTAGRNGASWSQPESPYAAKYPYNKVFAGESGHALEIDDTPGAERLNLAHRSGTFTETGPDGTQVTRIVGDSYTITDRDGYIMIDGIANVHVAGNCTVIIMSDTNLTMHGKVSMDFHNDVDVNIGGKLSMSVGGGIYARNAGKLSLDNYGNIDIDAHGNLSTDVSGNHNLTTYGENRMTSKGDIQLKTAGEMKVGSHGSFNVCSDAETKITSTGTASIKSAAEVNLESAAATNVKSGAAVNVEGAGNINLKAPLVASSPIDTPTLDVTTANITTANISTLNAGSTNLRATGTDTGTNGGSTHDLPISGPTSITASVTTPAAATSAVAASCPIAAVLSDTQTLEEPVSVSSSKPTQYTSAAGGSGGGGGGGGGTGDNSFAADDTQNDGAPEDGSDDAGCDGTASSDPSSTGPGATESEGTGSSSGDMTAGNVKASPNCDTLSSGKKLPALAKSGFPSGNIQLSEYYYLRDFVTGPILTGITSMSQLKSYTRNGVTQSVWDIVQNYRCLALNVLDPIVKKFGKPVINDGYRDPSKKKSNSAHQYAAIDIQFAGGNKQRHIDIATWAVKAGLPHDQLLVECKPPRKTAWIHIGYYWYNRQQRGEHWCGIQDAKATRISPNLYTYVSF